MTQNEFSKARTDAVNQMREMKNRSAIKEPAKSAPCPPETTEPKAPIKPINKAPFFLFQDSFLKDPDTTLILGLLLILMSEKSDKLLLFALLYILI